MRLLVTGATGFIGRALVAEAQRRGHRVEILTRDVARARERLPGAEIHAWDPERGAPSAELVRAVDGVIHLAGESVGEGRWTKRRMEEIRASRVAGTRALVSAFGAGRPRFLLSASGVGWYGDRGDDVLAEDQPAGKDFLAEVCRDWEGEASKVREKGSRWAALRTGIVLGRGGGALARMLLPFRLNLGGRLGSGRQWMSWIHLDDIVGLYLHAAEREVLDGPVNATAPFPVPNREFTRTLAEVLGKWAFVPAPGFMLRVAVGKFAAALLSSQRCDPAAAKRSGYGFRFPMLEGALRQILA